MGSYNISNYKNQQLNLPKTKGNLDFIKSDFFLRKVFDGLIKKKSLEIVKYNKNNQKRLNLSINDYKNYSEKFSSIEIEIVPFQIDYGKFIHIENEEDKKYYHIYFNDKKEEIKENYFREIEKVKKIKIIIDYKVENLSRLFFNCLGIKSLNFKKFARTNINNMIDMFYWCSLLNELDVSNFKTNNVVKMSGMFYGCSSLKKINVSNFNTNNVRDMSNMFSGCSLLKKLDLSNFNTNKVIDMSDMFNGCSSLEEIELSSFNTNNVNDMRKMFFRCLSLKRVNFSKFNIANVTDMDHMFGGCNSELGKIAKEQIKNIRESAFL